MCWNHGVGNRIGRRAVLACSSALALCGLTACSPSQPEPISGGATLSEDVIPYDHPGFLTSRAPVLPRFNECSLITPEVLAKLTLQIKGNPHQDRKDGTGCSLVLADAEIKIATSPIAFQDYWLGTAHGEGAPGAQDNLHNKPPTSFERKVLAGKYYEVEFSTYAGTKQAECHAVIDTGSAQPFVVTSNPYSDDPFAVLGSMNQGPSVRDLKKTFCPASTAIAKKLLAIVDANGGSRAK